MLYWFKTKDGNMDTEYLLKKSCISLEGQAFTTYGIAAVELRSRKTQFEITDVSLDKAFVSNLVKILNSSKIEICHFSEVITDELNK